MERCEICNRRLFPWNRNKGIAGVITHVTHYQRFHTTYYNPICSRFVCEFATMTMNEENYPEFADEVLLS